MTKVFVFFLLGLLLASCASSYSSYEGRGGPFSIRKVSEEDEHTYAILSVRENGVVAVQLASDTSTAYRTEDIHLIPKDSIALIRHERLRGLSKPGAAVGFVVGALAFAFVASSADHPAPVGGISDFAEGMDVAGAAVLGGIVGLVGAGLLFSPQSSFDLSKPNDREKLMRLSRYPAGEPPELEKIK